MLLMVEKGIRGGMCHAIYRCVKANDQYMKDYDKTKELSYLKYQNANNVYRWEMPIKGYKWVENTSQFHENFLKSYNPESGEGCFLETDVCIVKYYTAYKNDLPFLQKRMKIEKVEKLAPNSHDKQAIHKRNLKQAQVMDQLGKKCIE